MLFEPGGHRGSSFFENRASISANPILERSRQFFLQFLLPKSEKEILLSF